MAAKAKDVWMWVMNWLATLMLIICTEKLGSKWKVCFSSLFYFIVIDSLVLFLNISPFLSITLPHTRGRRPMVDRAATGSLRKCRKTFSLIQPTERNMRGRGLKFQYWKLKTKLHSAPAEVGYGTMSVAGIPQALYPHLRDRARRSVVR